MGTINIQNPAKISSMTRQCRVFAAQARLLHGQLGIFPDFGRIIDT